MDTQPGQVFNPLPTPDQAPTEPAESPPQQPQQTQSSSQSTPTQPFVYSGSPASDSPVESSQLAGQIITEPLQTTQLDPDLAWTASEFLEHPKSAMWYAVVVIAGVLLAAIDYLVTKDSYSPIVIVIAAILFAVYAGHKPQTQRYELDPDGLSIGGKLYNFHAYKSFSIAEEGSTVSIVFAPLARFALPLTIYLNAEIEGDVVDYISNFLPAEKRQPDAIDGLLRRIRF